mmetsp:Transcript_37266/g.57799  ORF Transcript_37266/g.57799 Transcript_37266/m.57799 type:complete len:265 (+) Transcript_37266:428-1222(+)
MMKGVVGFAGDAGVHVAHDLVGADFDDAGDVHFDEAGGEEFEDLGGEDRLGFEKDVMVFAFHGLWNDVKGIGGARHPGGLGQGPTQVPSGDHGKDPSADKAFPRLVGAQTDEIPANELATTGNTGKVGHNIVDDDQQEGKGEPKQAVENIVHDVLHLSNRQTQDNDRPTQLIQLKLDMPHLHRRYRQDETRRIQRKRYRTHILRIRPEIMQLTVILNHFGNEISVGIENGHAKPSPLRRSKERNRIFDGVEVGIVPDLDEFAKE